MLSSTVERFSGVRLGSGNTTGETEYTILHTIHRFIVEEHARVHNSA